MTSTLTNLPARPDAPDPPPRIIRMDTGRADVETLNRLVGEGARAVNEHPGDAGRLDDVIPKPWGFEFRAFADEYLDVWSLHIGPGHATSMHAHPRKLTYLVCLGGTGMTAGLSSETAVGPGTIMRIAAGAFHSTRNTGGSPLQLAEVEVPRNKLDLLALTSHADLGGTGHKTEFYVPEAARPHRIFTEAGYDVDFVSVQGGDPPREGVHPGDHEVTAFLRDHGDALSSTPAPGHLYAEDYDAIFYVGGHGAMWGFPASGDLAALAAEIYAAGGVIGAVCHGQAGLVDLQLDDGTYLIDGRRLTSFTNDEEDRIGLASVVPFAAAPGVLLPAALQLLSGR